MPNIAIFGGTFNPIHWGHLFIAEAAVDQFCLDRVLWVPTAFPPHKTQPLVAFEHRLEMIRRAIADHPAFTVSAVVNQQRVDSQQPGASYAIDTLQTLQTLEPNARWYWIIGSDAFQSLPKWRASQSLADRCIWLVAPRPVSAKERVGKEAEEAEGAEEHREADEDEDAKEARNAAATTLTVLPPFSSLLTPHSSLLSPYPSPLTPLSSPLTPHPSLLSLRWHLLDIPPVAISSSLIRQRCREGRSIRYLVPEVVRHYVLEKLLYKMS